MAVKLQGAGLGLRREMLDDVLPVLPGKVDFWEVAPENWIPLGGKYREDFNRCVKQAVFTTHGLSLSIGGPDPLEHRFLQELKHFKIIPLNKQILSIIPIHTLVWKWKQCTSGRR